MQQRGQRFYQAPGYLSKASLVKSDFIFFDKADMFEPAVSGVNGVNDASSGLHSARCFRCGCKVPASASIISVEHVFKSVTDSTGTLAILRDIDFSLAARETAAIVGASGSGKSTLLSIIAGLDTPTQGTVKLAGQDLFALGEDDRAALRAQKVGFVFQSFQLMGNLSALENVMLPLELSGAKNARAQATEMLKRVGLGERLGHYPKVLSGGEQQRVALARAFVVQPAVLLADEPTGSLDFATGETVMSLMFELNRELGTTLVLVTHDQAIAARCERRITIDAGRVVSA
jgi:putative ABC transport system ATP-binding protein